MATNILAVSCLPIYRAIARWAIPNPDQSAKLAVVYSFFRISFGRLFQIRGTSWTNDLSPYLDVFTLGTTAVLSFRIEYWEHFSMMTF